jgi:hypothetical protein
MLVFLSLPFLSDTHIKGSDLTSFITGARIVSTGDVKSLYETDLQLSIQKELTGLSEKRFLLPFRNPPVVAYLYLPYAYFSLSTAYCVEFFINLIGILVFFYLLTKANKTLTWQKLLPLLFFWPVINSIYLGQMTVFFLLIFSLIYILLKKSNHYYAGLLTGLLTLKPQLLLALPFLLFLMTDRKRYVWGLVSSLFLFGVLNLLPGGVGLIFKYFDFLQLTEGVEFGSRYFQMFSFYPVMQTLFGVSNIKNTLFMGLNIALYFIGVYCFYRQGRYKNVELGFSLALLATIVFSPHLLAHDLIYLVFPFVFSYLKDVNFANNLLTRMVLYAGPLLVFVNLSWVYGLFLFFLWGKFLIQTKS